MRRILGFMFTAIVVAVGCMTSGNVPQSEGVSGPEARDLDPEGGFPPCCVEVYEEPQGQYGCNSGLQCCSNVCTMPQDGGLGLCTCASVGGYCYVSTDCCMGRCNSAEGCCLDDAGNCPNEGGNPWLDGQL